MATPNSGAGLGSVAAPPALLHAQTQAYRRAASLLLQSLPRRARSNRGGRRSEAAGATSRTPTGDDGDETSPSAATAGGRTSRTPCDGGGAATAAASESELGLGMLTLVGRALALRSLSDSAKFTGTLSVAPASKGAVAAAETDRPFRYLFSHADGTASGANAADLRTVASSTSRSISANLANDPTLAELSPDSVCVRCGSLLHPSLCSGDSTAATAAMTTVRVRTVGRGRTRRRRASRVRARELRREEMILRKGKGGGREWGGSPSRPNPAAAATASGDGHGHAVASALRHDRERMLSKSIRSVRDGTRYHCVVHTCGTCGYKTKFGGAEVAVRERRRERERAARRKEQGSTELVTSRRRKGRGGAEELETAEGEKKSRVEGGAHAAAVGDAAQGLGAPDVEDIADRDYISLGPRGDTKASVAAAPPPPSAASSDGGASYSFKQVASDARVRQAATGLQQLQGSKRRKRKGDDKGLSKKADGKKSKLMDFLSSLND